MYLKDTWMIFLKLNIILSLFHKTKAYVLYSELNQSLSLKIKIIEND